MAVDSLGAIRRDLLVDTCELEEGGGDLPVLRLAGLEQQMRAQRLGNVQLDVVRQLGGRRLRALHDLPFRKLEEEPAVSA